MAPPTCGWWAQRVPSPSVQGSFNHVFSAGDEITFDAYQSSGVTLGFDASNNGLSLQIAKLS